MVYKAEYIWIDGTMPTSKLRSKTKILEDGAELPLWGFDGSSTNQATGDKSDCVLKPVASYPDPIRGGDDVLVMCEVMLVDGKPHPTNMRAAAAKTAKKYKKHEPMFGIEQEFTLMKEGRPYGFPPAGYPEPQGGYYCGVGEDEIHGRPLVEDHLEACLAAGLSISGINAEVMPGQWEFQVGPVGLLEVADQLWIARWLLYRIGEDYGIAATLDAKPAKGDWNGAGAHTNFSTIEMREEGGYKYIEAACKALGLKVVPGVQESASISVGLNFSIGPHCVTAPRRHGAWHLPEEDPLNMYTDRKVYRPLADKKNLFLQAPPPDAIAPAT